MELGGDNQVIGASSRGSTIMAVVAEAASEDCKSSKTSCASPGRVMTFSHGSVAHSDSWPHSSVWPQSHRCSKTPPVQSVGMIISAQHPTVIPKNNLKRPISSILRPERYLVNAFRISTQALLAYRYPAFTTIAKPHKGSSALPSGHGEGACAPSQTHPPFVVSFSLYVNVSWDGLLIPVPAC